MKEYEYDFEELMSFVNVLLAAAENEDAEISHEDIEHNIEIIKEKLHSLHNKLNLFSEKF